jgi:hypothetical protein
MKLAENLQKHDNVNVRNIGKNEAQHRKYKRLDDDDDDDDNNTE